MKIKLKDEDGDIYECKTIEELLQWVCPALKMEYWDGWQWI